MAEEMLSKHAVEEVRKELLDKMLYQPSVGREISSCGSSGDEGTSMGTRELIKKLEKCLKSDFSNICTKLNAMKESQEGMKVEFNAMKNVQGEMKDGLDAVKNSIEVVKGEMNSLEKSLEGVKGEVNSAKIPQEEMKDGLDAVKKSQEEMKNGLDAVKKSQEEMRNGLDAVKMSQEEMKDRLDAVKKSLEGVKCESTTIQTKNVSNSNEGKIIPEIPILEKESEIIPKIPILDAKSERENCIEGIMGKTKVIPSNEEKISKMRKLYEEMYDRDSILSTILQFIQSQIVEVHVDFESNTIERMKPTFRDHDGREQSKSEFSAFADFEERKAYVGGNWSDENIIFGLALALSQLCVLLAFGNKGLPYSKDEEGERELYKGILEEAEGKKIDGVELYIGSTQMSKEIYFHSLVPAIIAAYGSSEGRSRVEQEFPSLLEYIEDHVMTALRGE